MGEIPDWLIELAENAENEDTEQIREELTESLADQPTESLPEQPTEIAIESPLTQVPDSGFLEEPVALMDELRSQVEPQFAEELQDEPPAERLKKPISFAGMVPWQLAILSIMIFLDIAIVGLLFLAILGRISIP